MLKYLVAFTWSVFTATFTLHFFHTSSSITSKHKISEYVYMELNENGRVILPVINVMEQDGVTDHCKALNNVPVSEVRPTRTTKLALDENGQHDQNELQTVLAQGRTKRNSQTKLVAMQHCVCTREIEVPLDSYSTTHSTEGLPYRFSNTTCSTDAFQRGSGQKVIGFSFYESTNTTKMEDKGYFEGLATNLKMLRTFFPSWTMRLYFDLDSNHPAMKDFCDLACSDPLLDLCHAGELPGTPMIDSTMVYPRNWRYFPTLDPQVDAFLARDLDSCFSWRESSAVAEWLLSEQPMHVMRDNPMHNSHILGGMWGCHMLKKSARLHWRQLWNCILQSGIGWRLRTNKHADQKGLNKLVWPWVSTNAIQHDSYNCQNHFGSVAFPTKRLRETSNFVGAVCNRNHTTWKPCPVECRPTDHQDWEQC